MEEENQSTVTETQCMTTRTEAEGDTELQRYYLARRTVLEMLRDRGYLVASSETDISLSDFCALHGWPKNFDVDRLKFSGTHKFDPSKRMLIIFFGTGIVKVNAIRLITAQVANKDSLTGLVLVLQSHMTSQAQKALELFSFKVEMFLITDLLVNITKHVLKPKHQVLTEKEKKKLLERYNIEEKQLPRLLKKDAIARYYGLEKGQVVKITYSDEITESHVTYRCVW